MSEFWRRWHISLGRWLKTYLFYPIAVSKPFLHMGRWLTAHIPGKAGVHLGRVLPGCIGTLITFLVIGMWHGANWRYAGFGLWNGIIIFISMLCDPLFRKFREKIGAASQSFSYRLFQIARTAVLVLAGFAFDIADNLRDSVAMLVKMCDRSHPPADDAGDQRISSCRWVCRSWTGISWRWAACSCSAFLSIRNGAAGLSVRH